jgi:PIN domain nuclease of toxin-antitoxin system
MTPLRGHLLDASALLAVLFNEPGSDVVARIIDDCAIHSLNLAETFRKMLQAGVPAREAKAILEALDLDVNTDLSTPEALAAGRLAYEVPGLSLGDCVCLSVAEQTGQKAVTADRRWSEIANRRRIKILQIRG